MAGNFSFPYDIANGTTGDADEVMANFNEIRNNFDFSGLDDASANAAAMQQTTDPYPAGSESLATDGAGELKRLRYVLKQILGTAQWYIYPDMVTKTTTYTATANDEIILADTSGGAWTLTLPTAVGIQHKKYTIVLTVAGNDLTIDGDGTETIAGATTVTLTSQYQNVTIVSDGANWQIIGDSNIQTTGTYSPSVTNVANYASGGVQTSRYHRVNDIVQVFLAFNVTPTAANTLTRVRLTLPIASSFTDQYDLMGSAAVRAIGLTQPESVSILADSTNDEAEIYFMSQGNTNTHFITGQFTYQIV